jgi:hypothetical protein
VSNVDLEPGDPAFLRFDVRTGRRLQEVVVPVTRDQLREAEAMVERFRHADG